MSAPILCLICSEGPHEPQAVHAYVTETQWYAWLNREGDPDRGPDPSVSPRKLASWAAKEANR